MPGRWAIVSAGVVVALWAGARPSGQAPALKDVLERAAAYVERFQQQLSQIVSEETYTQTVTDTTRFTNTLLAQPTQRLRSDLILVKPSAGARFVELRDVFEVNGSPIRDREARLEALLHDPRGGVRIDEILKASARYNIGSIMRNINTPVMPLQ